MEYLGVLFPQRPRRALARLFATGRVRSAGFPVGAKRTVRELRDLVLVGGFEGVPEIFTTGQECGVAVLHENAHVTVLDKPSGVPVVPDRAGGRESCLGYVLLRELDCRVTKTVAQYVRPRIAHRIDRLTSGLVIIARTPEAERGLGKYFEAGMVRKEYLTILRGCVDSLKTTVNCPIAPGRKGRMRVGPEGKSAQTEFEVVERLGEWTLAVARPRTGRTHQIRVHAFAMGHPVADDPLYGRDPVSGDPRQGLVGRLALHAWRYSLPEEWPEMRSFLCPPPADFTAALRRLRGGGES